MKHSGAYYLWLFLIFFATSTTRITASRLPAHVKEVLDKHAKQLNLLLALYREQPHARCGMNVHEVPWLRGYFIKCGIERFENVTKLRAVILADKLDLLSVPHKYLYHVPGRPEKLSSKNYLVIVEKITRSDTNQQMSLNLAQAKQLCKVAIRARHYDLHPSNYILKDGKVVIIDTDECAMPTLKKIKKCERDRLWHGTRVTQVNGVYRPPNKINDPLSKIELGMCPAHTHYDNEAKAYIVAQVKKREAHFQQMKKRSAFFRFFRLV